MRAVFLDAGTFSAEVVLNKPTSVHDWVVFQETPHTVAAVVERLQGAMVAVLNKVPIGEEVLAQLPDLRLIQVTATGTDVVDAQACTRYGVVVQNVAGYSTDSVAEHAWMLILSAMRALPFYAQATVDGTWQASGCFTLNQTPIWDIHGRTLGIIGAGAIGRRVAEIAQVFGMQVLFAERQGCAPRDDSYTVFESVLARCDVLALHCPLTAETRHLINADTLALMQRRPLLVNMARGAVIDDEAVAAAVRAGQLSGLVTDVFSSEPPLAEHPLLTLAGHPRVIFTPHNAWASIGAQQRLWAQLCARVDAFLASSLSS